jgi:hypothetical protein
MERARATGRRAPITIGGNMSICYCCHRNEEEVRNAILEILQTELKEEEQFVKMEMEEENKKILDLQEEWERLKKKTTDDVSNIFGMDVFYLLQNVASNQSVDIKKYFEKAEQILGNSINSIKVNDIEKELKDKIDKVKNLTEYNIRLGETRIRFQERINNIKTDKWLIQKKRIDIKEPEKKSATREDVSVAICRICSELMKAL